MAELPEMNVFQQAVCPELPTIEGPVVATIAPGGQAVLKDKLFNNVVVNCQTCEAAAAANADTENADTGAQNVDDSDTAEPFTAGFSLYLQFDLYFWLMVIALAYFVLNDKNLKLF